MTSFVSLTGQNLDRAMLRKWAVVLRNLISLGKVRIEVVLASEDRFRIDAESQRQSCAPGVFHSAPVEDRECAGQTEANRASVRIWLLSECCGAGAEDLGFRA